MLKIGIIGGSGLDDPGFFKNPDILDIDQRVSGIDYLKKLVILFIFFIDIIVFNTVFIDSNDDYVIVGYT